MLINDFIIIIIYFLNIRTTYIRIGNELFLILHNVPKINIFIYSLLSRILSICFYIYYYYIFYTLDTISSP